MKKTLSFLLIICMLSGFVCGCAMNDNSTVSELNDEQLIQQTISDYLKSVYAFDFTKAKEFIAKDTGLYLSIEQMSLTNPVDSLINAMFENLDMPSAYKEKISIILKEWITKVMSDSEIETLNIDILNDGANAYVKSSTPDLSKIGEYIGNYENYISEEQLSQLMQKYLSSIGENTQWDLIVDALPVVLENAISDIEYYESETTITLQKIENNWLILSDEQ